MKRIQKWILTRDAMSTGFDPFGVKDDVHECTVAFIDQMAVEHRKAIT